MMKRLLQINVCSNVLSTGKICEDIAKVSQNAGWDTYIVYNSNGKPSVSNEIPIGSKANKFFHYLQYRLFDNEGLNSQKQTKYLLRRIEEIMPDIIHLHNIHDHWLNYPLLFNYIADRNIPVVWTQHDCWAFTGGCMYFDFSNCERWKNGCVGCLERRGLLVKNRARKNFELKKLLIEKIPSITFVPVSNWLGDLMKQSVQKNRPIITIHNGVDISRFRPATSIAKTKFKVIGVAAVWDARKGLDDFIKLRNILPSEIDIILVGLTSKQIESLPKGFVGICRTSSVEELVQLYSDADVFVNPTYADNFPTTNIEALACGTPVITYKTGGSPEAIDEETGVVVEQGNLTALAEAILRIKEEPLSSETCRKRAVLYFDKDKSFKQYLNIYNELINKNE
ncbi:glycosyltransferase [Bacteroides xylanisolvens]|nr:glycosyltransferase [Bacteroides xylanisolvens]